MQVAVLGPLEVSVSGRHVDVSGGRLRALLIMLALNAPRSVPIGELTDGLWGDEVPGDPANALQSLVSRLRRILGGRELITQHPGGYQLAMPATGLDVRRFLDLARSGHHRLAEGRHRECLEALGEGLALWRGPAPAEVENSAYLAATAARWEEVRLEALADRAEAMIALGEATDLVADLEELTLAYPLRERFAELLVKALAHAGRLPEALAAFERHRVFLAEELGSDPGPTLQRLHLDLLRGEVAAVAAAERPRPGTSSLPAWLTTFVGRTHELDQVSGLLGANRLTTVMGPGGGGKTRLATEAARTWQQRTGSGSGWPSSHRSPRPRTFRARCSEPSACGTLSSSSVPTGHPSTSRNGSSTPFRDRSPCS